MEDAVPDQVPVVPAVPDQVPGVCGLSWGPGYSVEHEIGNLFEQWSQGFIFSPDCCSALVQDQGGPCSVIIPAQAYIIKYLLFDSDIGITDATVEQSHTALISALQSILLNITADSDSIYLVAVSKPLEAVSSVQFHRHLNVQNISKAELPDRIPDFTKIWCERFGVLSFLYSAVLTRGLDNVTIDLGTMGDNSLIDSTFGHGNQSLLNLMLTGIATPNVFDFTKDVAGLTLTGVQQQDDIGFLTLLEALRYLKVGEFLKSPRYPIWVVGSESHLSLVFSRDVSLSVGQDTPFKTAMTAFDSFDGEGNGFIPVSDLPNLLDKLEMCSEPEYVDFMKDRLDPDSTGIVLFTAFIEEFVPGALDKQDEMFQHKRFTIHHYNGLKQSNVDRKVVFREGAACIYMEYNQVMEAATAPTPLLRVLRTKWPTIEIDWQTVPSIS